MYLVSNAVDGTMGSEVNHRVENGAMILGVIREVEGEISDCEDKVECV